MIAVYDAQAFSVQEYGGITRYFTRIIGEFSAGSEIAPELLVKYSNNHYLREIGVDAAPFFAGHRFRGRNEIIKALNRAYVKKKLRQMRGTYLFHPTYYDPYFIESIGSNPFALTVHDMAHELYPHMFSRLDFTPEHKRTSVPAAARLIAVSQNTKNDLMRLYGVPDEKIDVIHHANSLDAAALIPQGLKTIGRLPERFVLFVGTRKAYKNFSLLLRAMASMEESARLFHIFCAGGGALTAEEEQEIGRAGMAGRVHQRNVNDAELACLYATAAVFVFPSLYEGFGIPVLEAFACGCPAVLSDRSSLPEVGGDAADYFDPDDAESLARALARVLHDRTHADRLRARGNDRVKQFSWAEAARKTAETYKKIMRMRS